MVSTTSGAPIGTIGWSSAALFAILVGFLALDYFPAWYLRGWSSHADAPGRILQLHTPSDFAIVALLSGITTALLTNVKARSSAFLSTVFSTGNVPAEHKRDVHVMRLLTNLSRSSGAAILIIVGVTNIYLLIINSMVATITTWIVTDAIFRAAEGKKGENKTTENRPAVYPL